MSVHRYGDEFCRDYLNYSGRFVCTHCGHEIAADPFIAWLVSFGVGKARDAGHIFLHPACALDLCVRMIRDVHEIECRENVRADLVSERSIG